MKSKLRNIILKFGVLLFSNRNSKILFYHDIHKDNSYSDMSTPLELFKKHIKTIRQGSFDIVSEITQKENQIKLQFDDGFKGIFDCLSFLVKEEIAVEVFIITSLIGKENYLSEEQIIKLSNSGFVKISSHTHSHQELNNITEELLEHELLNSKYILGKILNKNVDSICYPFGFFSKSVIQKCQSSEYIYQYSSLAGSYHDNPFENVYRRNLVQFASCDELILILKGANIVFNMLYFAKHFSK